MYRLFGFESTSRFLECFHKRNRWDTDTCELWASARDGGVQRARSSALEWNVLGGDDTGGWDMGCGDEGWPLWRGRWYGKRVEVAAGQITPGLLTGGGRARERYIRALIIIIRAVRRVGVVWSKASV